MKSESESERAARKQVDGEIAEIMKPGKRIAAVFVVLFSLGFAIEHYELWLLTGWVAVISVVALAFKECFNGVMEALERRRLDSGYYPTGTVLVHEVRDRQVDSPESLTLRVKKLLGDTREKVNNLRLQNFKHYMLASTISMIDELEALLDEGFDPGYISNEVVQINKEVIALQDEWSIKEGKKLNNNHQEWVRQNNKRGEEWAEVTGHYEWAPPSGGIRHASDPVYPFNPAHLWYTKKKSQRLVDSQALSPDESQEPDEILDSLKSKLDKKIAEMEVDIERRVEQTVEKVLYKAPENIEEWCVVGSINGKEIVLVKSKEYIDIVFALAVPRVNLTEVINALDIATNNFCHNSFEATKVRVLHGGKVLATQRIGEARGDTRLLLYRFNTKKELLQSGYAPEHLQPK